MDPMDQSGNGRQRWRGQRHPLYAVLFPGRPDGHFQWFGWMPPKSFAILSHPLVVGTTGSCVLSSSLPTKIPWTRTPLWGAIHALCAFRLGALLAAGIISQGDSQAWTMIGRIAGRQHLRHGALLQGRQPRCHQYPPEPVFQHRRHHFTEEAAVVGGLWLAFQHPLGVSTVVAVALHPAGDLADSKLFPIR